MKRTQLIAYCHENIGQVLESDADAEVQRMINQTGNSNWHKDFSDEMFVSDESDPDVYNPCTRSKGYCFVTCSNQVEILDEPDENKPFSIGTGLTLQDLIDYASKIECDPSNMPIMIQVPDTMRLYHASQDTDEVYEPMIVLY